MNNRFTRIFDLYYNDIYRFIYSYTLNIPETKDILQETFLKFYKNISKLPDDDIQIKKWLIKVASNQSKDYFKSKWKSITSLSYKDIPSQNTTEENLSVFNTLLKLNSKYRVPIYLYYYEGYSINEIASILNISVSATKMRLSNAKKKIQKEMER